MSDIFNISEIDPVLSAVAERMLKLHISALTISLLENGKQGRVSVLMTDGQCLYAMNTTTGSMRWVSYDSGMKSDWTRSEKR